MLLAFIGFDISGGIRTCIRCDRRICVIGGSRCAIGRSFICATIDESRNKRYAVHWQL